ncbi:MAG: hypothetical protein U0K87_09740 [Ruminococcus sp.]|nr:hypothetical protein [Ruminococcus sp.]
MKKVLCVLISILLIVFSVPMTAFAEQEATYKTIPVEYSDNRKETEHIDVMIKNNNVFVNAEQLANRFSYDIEIDENKVSIKSLENPALPGVYVVFYFDDTKVTKMLYSDFCTKFEAPFASEKNEKGVWIPFEYSVLILNSGITILDDCVLIDIPEKTILDYFFDVQINSSRFNFDWAKDFGLDKVNVDIMGVSSHWTNMLNGVLAFDYLSWVQLFQTTNTLGMFTTAYDGKYGEKIATLICTQSDEELKSVVNQIDEINDVFSDDGHLGNALKNYSKELDASTGSIYNSCNKLLEDIKSDNSSTAKYNKTYRELEKALDKQTWFSNSGERIVDVQKGLSKATTVLDIISYIADYLNCINEFQNQDEFSVSSLKSEIGDNHLYGNLLLHDMKSSMKFYANQLSTDVGTYSAVQFIENNATKLFEKGTKVTAALGSKANYMLFAWNLASNFVPFFSEGLKATDNFELAMYSQIFQSDAYINYLNLKNLVFLNNDNLTSEDLYKVSQYCYIYLKSCYVTRNAALGSILPDKKEKMSTIIDTQNETNKEIAEIMAHIKNADIENKNNAYGFLLSDNQKYIKEYDSSQLLNFTNDIKDYSAELFNNLTKPFIFSSWAGAWRTQIYINPDGTLYGEFNDQDMIGGEGYIATIMYCEFKATLKNVEKVNDFTYSMDISELEYIDHPNTVEIKDNTKYEYVKTAPGFERADKIYIYTPEALLSELPEKYNLSIMKTKYKKDEALGFYGLYNEAGGAGFISQNK